MRGIGRTDRVVGFVLLFAVALSGLALAEQSAPFGRDTKRSLKVLELRGSPYERGLLHGRELRSDIAQILALWEEDLRASTKQDPHLVIRRFLAETNFLPAIHRWTPDLLEEVRGLADGSGQSFERVFAFQLVDELWIFNDAPQAHHCSSLGVARSDRHPAYVAQNMDLEPFRDGFQVVLHIIGDGHTPEQYVFSSAGLIGLNGVNRHAIAVACNTLMELAASADGLPVAFVVRGLLAQTSGDAALEFVRGVHHASGQNYVVGAGDRVYDFEASAGKVVQWQPGADGDVVYHTNHALANGDIKPWHRAMLQIQSAEDRASGSSATRLASLKHRLERPIAEIDDSVIRDALRARDSARHPVCRSLRSGAGSFTFGATVMTLSERPSLDVTVGPPDVNPFTHLEFATITSSPGTLVATPRAETAMPQAGRMQ